MIEPVCRYNELPEAKVGEHFRSRAAFQDITLREGQQAAEVALGMDERVELARAISECGVGYIQAGFAGTDEPTVRALKKANLKADISEVLVGFRDGWEDAARSAADAGADELLVLLRCADRQLKAMGLTRDEALRRIEQQIRLVLDLGLKATFAPSFVTVADEAFLRSAYRLGAESGATRFTLADTVGVAKPSAIAYLVKMILDETNGGAVDVHCHNDFGLAVANTVAGLAAGAARADVSVNGYGERAGNCPIDELAIALEFLYGVETGIRMEQLTDLDRLAERLSGVPLSKSKPVAGPNVFAQKLDIHVQLMRNDPSLLEPYPPERVGNRRAIRLGLGTGPFGVAAKLSDLGLEPMSEEKLVQLARAINDEAIATRGAVSDERFQSMVLEQKDFHRKGEGFHPA